MFYFNEAIQKTIFTQSFPVETQFKLNCRALIKQAVKQI